MDKIYQIRFLPPTLKKKTRISLGEEESFYLQDYCRTGKEYYLLVWCQWSIICKVFDSVDEGYKRNMKDKNVNLTLFYSNPTLYCKNEQNDKSSVNVNLLRMID
ncbi:MAG: hypothetical protein AB7V56_14665 [Candidatus Nitrosocosmicus sp.]